MTSGTWNSKLITDAASGRVFDFAMPRNSSTAAIGRIAKDRMIGTFAIEVASVGHKMSNQINAFHATGTSTESVSQMALPGASFSAFSA